MEGIQQYQRAVTPTVSNTTNDSSQVRGKVLSYSSNRKASAADSVNPRSSYQAGNRQGKPTVKSLQLGQSLEISGQSKPVANNRGILLSGTRQDIYGVTSRLGDHDNTREVARASSYLPRADLEPLSEEIPADGILFARYRSRPDSLVVFRLHDERARNPERLNLDRRQLDICPQLEQEQRLRLLNFQNNNIRLIQNIENLPNLIFLDLYNNKITSLDGCLSTVKGLRVLMVGKNRISQISNLTGLKKLDVLDLHSNEIKEIKGMEGLADLRVLNLAGNAISVVQNLQSLTSLTELNLRRNSITHVFELDSIPSLQRVFLSHNLLTLEKHISCLYALKGLIELSLDANPIAEGNPTEYRHLIIAKIPSLKHLDLRRVMDDERAAAIFTLKQSTSRSSSLTDKPPDTVVVSQDDGPNILPSTNTVEAPFDHHTSPLQALRRSSSGLVSPSSTENPQQGQGRGLNRSNSVDDTPTMQQLIGGGPSLLRAAPIIQNAFELEIINASEKALLVTGERWEWAHSKRMLSSVVSVTLRQMRKDVIISKFAINLSWIPNVTSYVLIENDIRSFSDLASVLRGLTQAGGVIKHLVIRENPICQLSSFILRNYTLAALPSLIRFNEVDVTPAERALAAKTFQLLLFSAGRRNKTNAAKLDLLVDKFCTGSLGADICLTSSAAGNGRDESVGNMTSRKSAMSPPRGIMQRRDLELKYPYKTAQAGSMGSAAAVGTSTMISVTAADMVEMALRTRKAELRFQKIFENTVHAILLETVENLQGVSKSSHKKSHGRNIKTH